MEKKKHRVDSNRGITSLEIEKLATEVEEAKLRIEKLKQDLYNEGSGLQKIWNSITKNLGVSLSLLTATAALWIQLDGFTHQRKQRQELEVSRELVILLEKLNSGEPNLQRTAAVGLSLFGEEAVSVLIENLDFDVTLELRRTLIEQLSAIVVREKNAWQVLNPLLQSTVAVFDRDLSKPYERINTANLEAYLEALFTLYERNATALSLKQREMVITKTKDLRTNLGDSKTLTEKDKKKLNKWLENYEKLYKE